MLSCLVRSYLVLVPRGIAGVKFDQGEREVCDSLVEGPTVQLDDAREIPGLNPACRQQNKKNAAGNTNGGSCARRHC